MSTTTALPKETGEMNIGDTIQQGDVILTKISTLPTEEVEVQGHKVLQHGETTGHMHQFAQESAVKVYHTKPSARTTAAIDLSFKTITDDEGKYLVVEAPSVLRHEEHHSILVEPGIYRLDIVSEFDYSTLEARRVVD